MALILARSPFFVGNEGLDRDATLTLDLERIDNDALDTTILKTYVLTFRRQTEIDISNLILPYLRSEGKPLRVKTTVEGVISEVGQDPTVNYHVAVDGYSYYEQGYNYDASNSLISNVYYAGSTDCVYYLDDSNIVLPFLLPTTSSDQLDTASIDAYLMDGGEVVRTQTVSLTSEDNGFKGFLYTQSLSHIDFADRVDVAGGTLEDNKCNQDFFDLYKIEGFDNIRLYDSATGNQKDIKVVCIEECKYHPYKVQFINKYGVEEDMWFFKRSDKSMNVKREVYRKNTFDAYSSGDITQHVYSNYNVMGRERIVMNSGYVPESFYEAFKQLYLSEQVWIFIDNKSGSKVPVNVSGTDIQERLHKNDKVINYEVEFEFSYDTIGNVV